MSTQQNVANVYSQYDGQVLCTRVSEDVNKEKVQSCLYPIDPMKYSVKALANYSQFDHWEDPDMGVCYMTLEFIHESFILYLNKSIFEKNHLEVLTRMTGVKIHRQFTVLLTH